MLIAQTASANLAGSTFEGNDGNLVVNTAGNTDWATVSGLNTGVDRPSGSNDNSFGQGTKEDNAAVTVVAGSIPPNKNDLSRFYEASFLGANGHNYLNLAWERLVNIGNANLDFEINQKVTAGFTSTLIGPITLNRTAGDLLVSYDFGGSGTPSLALNFWLTSAAGNTTSQCFSANALPCWGRHVNLSGAVSEGAVNTTSIVDPLQTGSPALGAGLFGEASIDLTAAGVFPAGICEAFGSVFVKSRSSSSFTAEIKDFIAPIAVNISNCGSITIHKVTENGDSSFGYTTTGSLTPSTFSLSNGGTQTYSAVQAGSYSVTENLTAAQVSAGWTLKSLTCTASGPGTSATPSGATTSITMSSAGTVDCVYTNNLIFHPTIATLLSAETAKVGDSITDSSTLSGASATAGGTVTYHAYAGENTCTGTDLLNSRKTVTNGIVPNSDAFIASAAGHYSFQAVYSGDAANAGATSPCSSEQLLVRASPTATTAQNVIPNDTFMLSGATATAGGTITMSLYGPGDTTCAGTPALTQTVTVSGNGSYPTTNTSFIASTEGTWRWASSYSGDTLNLGATSSCGTERFTIANS
ncbi:prealbumin-like fold domain-containing protein, partial [Jatrophihabitans sp.]|uniref:prealbumin-like fold domain-containing protein n=1 Tax=Jatrophihabitans sp. TaxID=1932789 RepID=UPI002EFB1537